MLGVGVYGMKHRGKADNRVIGRSVRQNVKDNPKSRLRNQTIKRATSDNTTATLDAPSLRHATVPLASLHGGEHLTPAQTPVETSPR